MLLAGRQGILYLCLLGRSRVYGNTMRKRIHILYSGRVQGVGFRFTAENIAIELGIQGWVKNLSDGRVEIMAQGEEEVLKDFLKRLNQLFLRYIKNMDIQWQDAGGEPFACFEVRY